MSTFVFCPMCGSKMGIKTQEFDHVDRNACSACMYIHYNNSVPTASVIITNEAGQILLVKRAWHPYIGFLDIPGGFIEGGEHPRDGAAREALEELSIEVEVGDLIGIEMGVYSDGTKESEGQVSGEGTSTLNLYFEAKIKRGEIKITDEIADFAWMTPDEVLKNIEKVAFNGNKRILKKYITEIINK